MIALYFAQNFTYSGSWDVYGGLGGNSLGSGSSGIAYFYHTGELPAQSLVLFLDTIVL